ncbi:MAG: YggS family pyridoxal phosphate enzyme [Chloroflexi bacterium RBG_13_53_26]|nr:MAG: YggS family pyridoxal phosphate enzyme [Chloroflexi bacterium RBG_13_53_26]
MHGNPASPDIKSADIGQNVHEVQRRIARAATKAGRSPADLTVIGVTKTVDPLLIQQAFQAGIRHFGESRIQEAKDKMAQLSVLQPRPTWHMVGHLQTNKVKTAIELFDVIHSVDSIRLAEAISEHAQQAIPILIQVNVSGEASKYGFPPNKVRSTIEQASHLPHLEIKGLMTIAPYTDNPEDIRPIFRQLRMLRDSLGLEHLSMGMTDDFEVAIEEGATMVRIGRAIFGERED